MNDATKSKSNINNLETNKSENNNEQLSLDELKGIALLKQIRSVSGITAEYLMTFLEQFTSKTDQFLIYSLCCNFHRLQHSIEIHLLQYNMHLCETPYDPDAFTNVSYVDVSLVKAIKEFLKEKENVRLTNRLFDN